MQDYGPGGDPALGNMAPNPSDAAMPMPSVYPEDTPMLLDPTQRPDEPITAGLPVGAGPGPAPGSFGSQTTSLQEMYQRAAMNDPSPASLQLLALAQRFGL